MTSIIPWQQPPPIDATMWSRPCGKCRHRIDKCICPEGPTNYGAAAARVTNDNVAIPGRHTVREDSEELWDLFDKEPEEFKRRLGFKEVRT